jgi:hypothetical protein
MKRNTNHNAPNVEVPTDNFEFNAIAGRTCLMGECGVKALTAWQLEPFIRYERIRGEKRTIVMRNMVSVYLKTLAIQLTLDPGTFGPKPNLRGVASMADVPNQTLRLILNDLRERFPMWVRARMRNDAVREIYRAAQFKSRDKKECDLDSGVYVSEQLTLF